MTSAGPARAAAGRESDFLDELTQWIRRHHRDGGDFSTAAISEAGQAGVDALRAGYSSDDAFQAARNAYFDRLGRVGRMQSIEGGNGRD